MRLIHGECLEQMVLLPDACVDMVLCDLPYGTTRCKWDALIDPVKMWAHYRRICKGAIVLTAAQPFTSVLVCSNLSDFRYQWVWKKNRVGGFFNAKHRPLKSFEDVLVFGKLGAAPGNGPKLPYYPQGLESCEIQVTNQPRKESRTIREKKLTRSETYVQTQKGYPIDILEIACESKQSHPTQKPVALMEYLIKTYTHEGMTVLDNCMGSGTTGVASVNTGRDFIGIEQDASYFEISKKRIAEAEAVRDFVSPQGNLL